MMIQYFDKAELKWYKPPIFSAACTLMASYIIVELLCVSTNYYCCTNYILNYFEDSSSKNVDFQRFLTFKGFMNTSHKTEHLGRTS